MQSWLGRAKLSGLILSDESLLKVGVGFASNLTVPIVAFGSFAQNFWHELCILGTTIVRFMAFCRNLIQFTG
jgi:hypothetical protein